ncbi:hypothetical protein RRG08_025104 [Elysia crispata]|uniref:Uncharacterized protein n=1 Tax=Elysia crispata TaxID=231223 RepID=A0AAE1AID7_9GAST|nr:hypothetical protein RRG08_025104 [Elysia crispata]
MTLPRQTTRQQPQHSVKTSYNLHPDPTPPLDSSRSTPKTTPASALTLTASCPDTPRRRLQPPYSDDDPTPAQWQMINQHLSLG